MPTNVTQKDQTLKQIISLCESDLNEVLAYMRQPHTKTTRLNMVRASGMVQAYRLVVQYCRHMLGYSGSMPLEVENQSEDAK